jgi:hypothetical protein
MGLSSVKAPPCWCSRPATTRKHGVPSATRPWPERAWPATPTTLQRPTPTAPEHLAP